MRLIPQRFRVGGPLGRAGLLLFAMICLFCFVGPLLHPTEQVTTNIKAVLQPPSLSHPLGTDPNGYDELGRVMLGGRAALEIGLLAAFVATAFGVVYGATAGYVGGLVDAALMRLIDALLAVPGLLLAIVLASIFRPTFLVLVLVLAMLSWLVPARLMRGETRALRARQYVEAARALGARNSRILSRHILPNAFGVIIVNATFQVADAILALSALSYLGFGPGAINWGSMLNDGADYSGTGAWWLLYPVGALIVLTVVALNFVGEGLQLRRDPSGSGSAIGR